MSEILLSKQDLAIAQVASTDATRQQLQAIAVRNIGGNEMRLLKVIPGDGVYITVLKRWVKSGQSHQYEFNQTSTIPGR